MKLKVSFVVDLEFSSPIKDLAGLTLEQVDKMLHETNPRKSAAWKPTMTFAAEMGIDDKGQLSAELVEDVQRHGHHHQQLHGAGS
jgi:hypothetical protein